MSDNGSAPEPPESPPPAETPPVAEAPPESPPPAETPPDGNAESRSKVLGVPIKMSSEARAVTATKAGAGLVAAVRALARRRDKKRVDPEADSAEADTSALESTEQSSAKGDSLTERRAKARMGGGQGRIDAQHARGKLTARERINRLLDPKSFEELGPYVEHRHSAFGLDRQRHAGDGVVTGFGHIDGRRVAVFAQDFTVLGGSFSETQALKVGRLLETATSSGLPVFALLDSVGARIQEGIWSLAGFGDLFWRNTQASGVVPQISLMLGPCAGGAVYSPGLTDFVIMARGSSYMFITGPDVIRTVTGEEVDAETLGGAETHAGGSGVAHFVADDENAAFDVARHLLGYLPSNNAEDPPIVEAEQSLEPDVAELDNLIPEAAEEAYDVREAITRIADRHSFLEVHADFARNAVVGFIRLKGRVAAVIGQPAGTSGRCARHQRLGQDRPLHKVRGLVQHPAGDPDRLPRLSCPAPTRNEMASSGTAPRSSTPMPKRTVPKVSVVLRKAYGGAYIVMSSKMIPDRCLPGLADGRGSRVMGAKGAVSILYARQLKQELPSKREAERARLEDEFEKQFNSPFAAAATGTYRRRDVPRARRGRASSPRSTS